MKRNMKKLISLILALVMLVTMIPAGILTASAEGADYIISSVDDWNALAAQNLTFEGKIVALGGNIDAAGAELKTLAAEFKGTFNGANYTISNAIVNGNGLIATTLVGGAAVKNVKFANVDLTGTGTVGMIAGAFTPTGMTKIEKINVDADSSVTGTTMTGGLIGQVAKASDYTLNINNISMKAAIAGDNAGGNAGGLIGQEGAGAKNPGTTNGHVIVSGTLIAPTSISGKNTGGIAGLYTFGANTSAKDDGTTKTAETVSSLTLTDVVVAGDYTWAVTGNRVNGFNVSYTNLYVTTAKNILHATSYASSLNGYHASYGATGGRDNLTVADIVSKGKLTEVPHIIASSAVPFFFTEDEHGFLKFDPQKFEGYETKDIFEIHHVDDWKNLAANAKIHDFDGKMIVLTADIDAGGEALPMLTLGFKGTFDGGSHTIKNATVNSMSLIAETLLSGATVKNVNFEGVTVNGTGVIADTLVGGATVQNVKFKGVTVNNSTGNAGMLAGTFTGQGTGEVTTIEKISIDGDSSIVGANGAGGLFGTITAASKYQLNITKLFLKASISADKSKPTGGIAGIRNGGASHTKAYVNLTDSLIFPSTALTGGIYGYFVGDMTSDKGIFNPDFSCLTMTNVIVAGDHTRGFLYAEAAGSKTFNYRCENVFVTTSKTLSGSSGYNSFANGILVGRIGTAEDLNEALESKVVVVVSASAANNAARLDDDGFIVKILDAGCDHEWSEYELDREATEDLTKKEKRTCAKCTLVDFKESPALGWTVEEFLADYDNRSTVNITSTADWNALAAAQKTFEGKTIKLCADIGGVLVPLTKTFAGTFLGGGFTIADSKISGTGLFAHIFTGNVTIENLKLKNVDVSTTGSAGLLAAMIENPGNITITRLNADAACSVYGAASVGGLFGEVRLNSAISTLTISYVMLDAAVTTTNGRSGGLIGLESSRGGQIFLENSAIRCIMSSASMSKYANGLIGISGEQEDDKIKLNINQVILGGKQKQFACFYMKENAEIVYDGLYLLQGTVQPLFGANRYDTFINGVRTTALGENGGRASLTVDSMTFSGKVIAPKRLDPSIDPLTLGEDGFIVKIGRPIEEPTLDLSDYETTTTFPIKNLADWKEIASSGKDFEGKKIVLEADIDAWGETVPTLADTFKGSFDGQGHTFLNAVMTGNGIIANTLHAVGEMTIENFKTQSVTVKVRKGDAGFLAGTLIGTDANVTIRKIDVLYGGVSGKANVGGLLGSINLEAKEKAITVDLSHISLTATVQTSKTECLGGLVGKDSSKGADAKKKVTMNISNSKIKIAMTIPDDNKTTVEDFVASSGLIGHYVGGAKEDTTHKTELNLKNIVIGGGTKYKVLTMTNGVVNYKDLYLLDASGNLFSSESENSLINGKLAKDVATTKIIEEVPPQTPGEGTESTDQPTQTPGEGTESTEPTPTEPKVEIDLSKITAETLAENKVQAPIELSERNANKMVLKDANGFISLVPDYIQALAVQRSVEVKDNKYSIRFVAFSQYTLEALQTMNLQMKITATWIDASGVEQKRIFDTASGASVDEAGNLLTGCALYEYLKVYGDYGLPTNYISADLYGAKAIAGFTIWDIPVDAVNMPSGITFEATMSYTNAFGATVTSRPMTVSVDAQGAIA